MVDMEFNMSWVVEKRMCAYQFACHMNSKDCICTDFIKEIYVCSHILP